MNVIGIIPARYASSRLPAKPLALIGQRTMLHHTYMRASQALDRVIIATDHPLIADEAHSFGAEVIMTLPDIPSGTARCAFAVSTLDIMPDLIVNIQADEPFIDPIDITHLVESFANPQIEIATLVYKFNNKTDSLEILTDTANPKVIVDSNHNALYFSRAVIPFVRNYPLEQWPQHAQYHIHSGIYAYRTKTLLALPTLPASTSEKAEQLEQLRWLDAGIPIHVVATPHHSLSIDTPLDLERANTLYR